MIVAMTTTHEAPTGTPATPAAARPPRMSTRAKLTLAVLCAAQFMVALDFSILNVALPTLGHDLGLGEADLQWAVTAFALPSGGFLLLFGRVGDIVGRRRLLLLGLGVFTVASLGATLAPDAALFLTARAVQGLGAAMIVPTGMALLTTSFAEGPQRDRALGVSGMLMSLGFTIGVVLGGVLTQGLGWRSTMALNVVMGALVLAAAPRLLRDSRAAAPRPRLDVPGAITVTGGLLAVIDALSTAARRGLGDPAVLGTLAVGVVLLAAFLVVEARTAQPLVALRMLRRRTVAWGNAGGLVTFSMMSSVVFLCTLYLQQVRGISPLASGLVFGMLGLGAAAGGWLAPRLVARMGAHRLLVAGLAVQAVVTVSFVAVSARAGVPLLLAGGFVVGLGHASAIVSYGITATSGLPDEEQGLATGLLTTTQQVAVTIGIPILSAVAAARSGRLLAAGRPTALATLGGVRLGLVVDGLVVLAAAALVAAGLLRRRRAVDPR